MNYLDSIYRKDQSGGYIYQSFSKVFSGHIPEKDLTPSQIYNSVKVFPISNAKIYCPLPINNHVDHILINNVGQLLVKNHYNVVFYEDIYTLDHSVSNYLKENAPKLKRKYLVKVEEGDISKHKSAIQCYKSQIKGLTEHTNMHLKEILSLLNHSNSKTPYIRLWQY